MKPQAGEHERAVSAVSVLSAPSRRAGTQRFNPAVPVLNVRPRRRLRLPREGLGAVALTGWVLASALFSHSSLVLLVFCLLTMALVVGAVQTVRNLRHLEITRRLPDRALAGRPVRIEFSVRNRRLAGTARAILLKSDVQPALPSRPMGVFLPAVTAREHVTEAIEVAFPKRGLYRFDALELTSRYPYGVLERSVRVGEPQELLVYPRLGRLNRRFFELEREQHLQQQGRRPGRATLEADYHGLREFRDGDSSRWIHWATSARRGRLMVKEFEARRNRDVMILLEPWLPARADARDESLLELAISFAATLCVELCQRQNLHVVLAIAADPPIIRHGQSSHHLLRELLGELALLRGTHEPPWDALLEDLPLAWISGMRITAISARPLELAARVPAPVGAAGHKLQRLTRRLKSVDVGGAELRDCFELI